jgi:glyoxylase-like metal-dependent hydrolase (beta-lactamase superfamily II)
MPEQTLRQLTPRVWWLPPDSTTDRPALGAIVGTHGTLVVDAGNSPAHARLLLAELERHGLPPPRFAALTHWHWDHVFGTAAFDVPTFAHRETQHIVRVMASLDWSDAALDQRVVDGREIAFCRDMIKVELPDRGDLVLRPPEIGFATEVELDLGGLTCQLVHVGGDHSPDSSIVVVPEEGVAFLADCLGDDLYHGPRRLTTGQLFPLLDRLLALEATCFIGGHDPAPFDREQLVADAALLRTIGELVADLGNDPERIAAALPSALGMPPDEDHHAIAEAFLAGLHLPVVASPL